MHTYDGSVSVTQLDECAAGGSALGAERHDFRHFDLYCQFANLRMIGILENNNYLRANEQTYRETYRVEFLSVSNAVNHMIQDYSV